MIELDTDLLSRQNARELVRNAKKAQAVMATFSQQQIDDIVKNVAQEAAHHAEALAKMAAEETGFGNWQDKVLKNRFASLRVYDAIKDMKTVGIIHDDQVQKVMDVGVPLGVLSGLTLHLKGLAELEKALGSVAGLRPPKAGETHRDGEGRWLFHFSMAGEDDNAG